MASRFSSHRNFHAEALERRVLLAGYTGALYFPIKKGNFWDYTGTYDGRDANLERTVHVDKAGVAQFSDAARVRDTDAGKTSRFYSGSSKGVFLNRQIISAGSLGSSDISLSSPIRFLSATAKDGEQLRWSAVPFTATVTVPGHARASGKGKDSGSSRVNGAELVDLGEGQFASAVKVTLDHTESFDIVAEGSKAHVEAHIVEVMWLARGIGVVRMDGTIDVTGTVDGESDSDHLTESFVLDGSNLMPQSYSSLDSSGTLTVNGSSIADAISLTTAKKQVTVSYGSIFERYQQSAVKRISILAGDGNDVVSIGTGVRGVSMDGGDGNDALSGGDGDDVIRCGAGRDSAVGGAGNDRIYGDAGNDLLKGGNGNDQLGAKGNDSFEGGRGTDSFDGGDGIDQVADADRGEQQVSIDG